MAWGVRELIMRIKRALITVDADAWEGVQRLLPQLKIPKPVFNEILNTFIRSQYRLLSELKVKKDQGENITMGTFLRMMSVIADDLESDQLKL